MPVDPELLEILVCPETKQSLRAATGEELAALNALRESGSLRYRGGERVEKSIEEGLVREDGRVLYVVDEGIPVMLSEESLELPH